MKTTPLRGTSAWRAEAWGPGCDPSVIQAHYWMIGASKIQCHKNVIRYFRAVGRVMYAFGYQVRGDVTGGYNCRKITGGTSTSAHSQGIALDVNWDTNPYRTDKLVTDMPVAMTEAIEALQTEIARRLGYRVVYHRLELYAVPIDEDEAAGPTCEGLPEVSVAKDDA